MTLFLVGPLVAESQPGLHQIPSTLGVQDGGTEIFSDPLLTADLWDDLQTKDEPKDHSVARQGPFKSIGQSLLTFDTQFSEKAVLDFKYLHLHRVTLATGSVRMCSPNIS